MNESWRLDALCTQTDPDLFFPEGTGGNFRRAYRICAACPVRQQCLDVALSDTSIQDGIWGGLPISRIVRLRASAA